MSSPQKEGQRCSTDDTAAVQNSPVHAESDISGASHSTHGDLTGEQLPQESTIRQPTTTAQMSKLGAVLSPCSSCSSAAFAPPAHGTSSGLRQPSDGNLSASVAQSSSVSAGPPPLCIGTTVAEPTEVQAGKTSVDANVTRSASTALPRSDVGTPQTTLRTSNTPGGTSTLEESNFGSPDAPTTQTDEGLDCASRSQRSGTTDDPATISRSPVTDQRVPQRGLGPNVSASLNLNHSNAVAPRHQQAPSTTTSRASSSQRIDMQPSAQQHARSGTSSTYPSHTHVPNVSVASITSPFDMPSSNRDFYLGYLAPQYPIDSGASENLVDLYTQYFHVC
ncbi:hypothetical protein V8D89_005826 [Ganoderma adspersum]